MDLLKKTMRTEDYTAMNYIQNSKIHRLCDSFTSIDWVGRGTWYGWKTAGFLSKSSIISFLERGRLEDHEHFGWTRLEEKRAKLGATAWWNLSMNREQ